MINNFLFFSLDLCHAFKLFNLRTYLNLDVVISFSVVNILVPLIQIYKKRSFSCSCLWIFVNKCFYSVQFVVYHCLSFSPFSFDHYMVLPFDIQILITPLSYSNLSSVYNRIYHNSTIKQQ